MVLEANCSKRKVVEANCSKNIVQSSKRKVVEANCSKRKVVVANCSKNIVHGQMQEHGINKKVHELNNHGFFSKMFLF